VADSIVTTVLSGCFFVLDGVKTIRTFKFKSHFDVGTLKLMECDIVAKRNKKKEVDNDRCVRHLARVLSLEKFLLYFFFIQKGLTAVYPERAADDLPLFATFTACLSAQCCPISSPMSLCKDVAANINQTQC